MTSEDTQGARRGYAPCHVRDHEYWDNPEDEEATGMANDSTLNDISPPHVHGLQNLFIHAWGVETSSIYLKQLGKVSFSMLLACSGLFETFPSKKCSGLSGKQRFSRKNYIIRYMSRHAGLQVLISGLLDHN